jgi:hypothetical protein
MNAEYIGENTIGIVGLAQVPGCVLTAPASAGCFKATPPSTLLDDAPGPASLEVVPLVPPLEHAATMAATLAPPTPRANATLFRFDSAFIITAALLAKEKMLNDIVENGLEQAMDFEWESSFVFLDLRNLSMSGIDGPARSRIGALGDGHPRAHGARSWPSCGDRPGTGPGHERIARLSDCVSGGPRNSVARHSDHQNAPSR